MKLKEGQKKNFIIFVFFVFFLLRNYPAFAEANDMRQAKEMAISEAFRERVIDQTLAMTETLESTKESRESESEKLLPFILSRTHVYGLLATTYNDNIFQLPDKSFDVIYTVTPGVRFGLSQKDPLSTRDRNKLEVDMGLEVKTYLDHSKLSRQNPYASLRAELGRGPHKLYFSNSFRQNSSPTSTISVGAEGTTDYKTNFMNLSFEATYKHFGYDFDCNLDTTAYEGDAKSTNSYRVNNFSLTGFLIPRSSPKTRLLLELETSLGDYYKYGSNERNFDDYRIWIGAQGKLAPKITGLAKIGYQKRDLKNQKDRNLFSTIMNLDYAFSRQTQYHLHVEHGAIAPTYSDEGVDIASVAALGYNHTFAFNRKVSFILYGSYALDEYSGGTSGRITTNKTYSFVTRLEYAFRRWLRAYLQYNYIRRFSDQSASNYLNNLYSLNMEASF